jgi:hypothetical protein
LVAPKIVYRKGREGRENAIAKIAKMPKIAGNDGRGRVMFGNSGASGN